MLTLPGLFFYSIAELFPRFGNLAYLPDRAWQPAAILTIPLVYLLLKNATAPRRALLSWLGLVLLVINVSGAFYVNYLTGFTIPNYELKASAYLDTLPNDKYIFSSSSKNIIRYHSRAKFVGISEAHYTNQTPDDLLEHIAQYTEKLTSQLADIAPPTASRQTTLPTIYIYYARTHPKNPYAERPYTSGFTGHHALVEFPSLDNNPELFEPIYTDGELVRIWRVKLDL